MSPARTLALAAAALAVLAGAALLRSRARVDAAGAVLDACYGLELGMTRAELEKRMGPAASEGRAGDATVFTYAVPRSFDTVPQAAVDGTGRVSWVVCDERRRLGVAPGR
jgi:hypothetical protein